MLRENRLISAASTHDVRRQVDVRRAVVSVLADREEHSIVANLVCWVILLSAYMYIGLTPLILLALTLRLAAMTATRCVQGSGPNCAKERLSSEPSASHNCPFVPPVYPGQ